MQTVQFKDYVEHMHQELLGGRAIESIIKNVWVRHQYRRFIMMYMLRDQRTFDRLYHRRHGYGIGPLFDQLIYALFEGKREKELKSTFIKRLGLHRSMVKVDISETLIREIEKDLSSFQYYKRKMEEELRHCS